MSGWRWCGAGVAAALARVSVVSGNNFLLAAVCSGSSQLTHRIIHILAAARGVVFSFVAGGVFSLGLGCNNGESLLLGCVLCWLQVVCFNRSAQINFFRLLF